jgi:exosome complex RNA-binding protein Csl4
MRCALCGEFLKYAAGMQCADCKYTCHRKCYVVGFADTLGNNLGVTLAVAGVLAIRTLHAGSILMQCADCKYTCHRKCYPKVVTKCISKANYETDPDL